MSDPAGNCGYNLPYAGLTVAMSCAGINDHTWAHEIGHALSLAHPFLGWEGGVSNDNSVEHDLIDPAPNTVTFDYTCFLGELCQQTKVECSAGDNKIDYNLNANLPSGIYVLALEVHGEIVSTKVLVE